MTLRIVTPGEAGVAVPADLIRQPSKQDELERLLSEVHESKPDAAVVITMDAEGEVTLWPAHNANNADVNWMLDAAKFSLFMPAEE